MKRPKAGDSHWAKLLGISLLVHLGKKPEVIGLKASWANALYSSPILVASATNVSRADLAYSVVSSKNLSGDFKPASFSKYALFASNDDLAKLVWAVVIALR